MNKIEKLNAIKQLTNKHFEIIKVIFEEGLIFDEDKHDSFLKDFVKFRDVFSSEIEKQVFKKHANTFYYVELKENAGLVVNELRAFNGDFYSSKNMPLKIMTFRPADMIALLEDLKKVI